MNITQKIEERLGLKIENLKPEEKDTYLKMLETVEKSQMTPERMKDYISSMRSAIEQEMVKEPIFIRILFLKFENPNLIKLQARLQNYILLESFLMSPDRAKKQLEMMIDNISKQ